MLLKDIESLGDLGKQENERGVEMLYVLDIVKLL